MRKILCPNCKSKKTSLALKKNGFSYYQCLNCQITFLDQKFPYEQFVKKFYTKGYFTGDKDLSAYDDYERDEALTIRNCLPIISQAQKYISYPGKHLDIGTAYGFLLEITQKYGFEPFGVEPSSFAAKIAQRKFGNQILKTTFEKAKLPKNSFALVTMFDVLEHFSQPKKMLKKTFSLLQNKGLLVITTCDKDSLFARVCGSSWHFYNPPQHLFIFDKEVLLTFLKEAGFTPLKVVKIGKWFSLAYLFHLAYCIQKSKIAYRLYQLTKDSFVGRLPIFLRFNDSMAIYAQKIQ